jgi:O-antigen ligase
MANTPHNGYLSLALRHGMIAAGLYLWFVARALLDGLRAFRRSRDIEIKVTGITISAAIVGLLVHNLVDGTFVLPYVSQMFWTLAAIAIIAGRAADPFPVGAPVAHEVEAPERRVLPLTPAGGRA